jgi:hypothetical protein
MANGWKSEKEMRRVGWGNNVFLFLAKRLEGLIKCGECGSMMTPRWCVSGTKRRYFYYGCTSVEHSEADACTNKVITNKVII